MLKLLVLTAAVLVSSASAASPCCGPKQYMGGIEHLVLEAYPGLDPGGAKYEHYGAWDYTNRRYGLMETMIYNGTKNQIRSIQDYAKGIEWTIYEEYKYCFKDTPFRPEPTVCIPDDVSFAGSVFIGGNGTDSMLVDNWSKTYHEEPLSCWQGISVRHKDCFPLRSQFMGTCYEMGASFPVLSVSTWFNITIGIPKPDDWFTVPSYCNQQEINSADAARPLPIPDLYLKRYFLV